MTQPLWPGTLETDYLQHSDRSLLLTASGDGTARIWDPVRKTQIEQLTVDGEIKMVAADATTTDDLAYRPIIAAVNVAGHELSDVNERLLLWSPRSMARRSLLERACSIAELNDLSERERTELQSICPQIEP